MSSRQNRFARSVERGLGSAALASYRNPGRMLLGVVAVLVFSTWGARSLSVDSDFVNVLPPSFPSVAGLDLLEKRYGGVGYVTVVGHGALPADLERFADDVTPKLAALPDVRYVKSKRPFATLEDRAGYFFDVEDLTIARERIGAREKYERRKHNPMYVDLGADEAPSLDFSDLIDKYRARMSRKGFDVEGTHSQSAYYLDAEHRMIAVFVKPTQLARDFDFDKRVRAEVEGVLASLDPSAYGAGFRIELTGTYVKKVVLQQRVIRDVAIASTLGMVLVLLYLALHFRSFIAIVLIMAPLMVGLNAMFGFAGLAIGKLSMLTAFVGVILLGLGIDHGIHFLGRFAAHRAAGASSERAIEATFTHTGRAVLVAAATTVVGFLSLATSEFKAFREFGLIAAVGMLMMVAAFKLMMPGLIGLAERFHLEVRVRSIHERSPWVQHVRRLALPTVVVALLLAPFVLVAARQLEFDEDFRTLEGRDRTHLLDERVDEIVGYSNSPIVVLTDDADDEKAATEELRRRMHELGKETRIDFVASLSDFVPADQPAKRVELQRIHEILQRVKPAWLERDRDRDFLDRALRMSAAEPFTRAQLPVEIRRQFSGMEEHAGFVLVFPGVRTSDGREVMKLADEVRSIRLGGGREVSAAGECMVLADILQMLLREAQPVILLTLLLVFLTLWVLGETFRDALAAFLIATATLAALFGVMRWAGLSLNYFNVMLIPVLFGASVDGAVHLLAERRRVRSTEGGLVEAGPPVAGSLLTTGMGFGSLFVASHDALRSFGEAAVIGFSANALLCLVVLPAILAVWERWRGRRAPVGSPGVSP